MEKGIFLTVFLILPLMGQCQDVPAEPDREKVLHSKKHKYVVNHKISQLEYAKYIQEVVSVLKSDPGLKNEINMESINTGSITEHMDKMKDSARSQLDELKRQELYRVKQFGEELKRRGQPANDVRTHLKTMSKHLDLRNMVKFSVMDLKKLIHETNAQLDMMDKERREIFKEYEMHKLLEFEELFARLSPMEKVEVKKNMDEMIQNHTRRKPILMPASKEHLMKVWEEKDQMSKENFNVKTFFHMHDLDGNGFMDEYEIKTLLTAEVLDLYDENNNARFDPKEREEEWERMREHTFTVVDTDKDHLISLDEFINNSKNSGFEDHLFWENVKALPVFSDGEYAVYQAENKKEVNKMIDQGIIFLDLSGIVQNNLIPDEEKDMKKQFNV